MKSSQRPNPASAPKPPLHSLFCRAAVLLALPALLLPMTGCIRTRSVDRTVVVPHVLDATLDQLLSRVQGRYDQVQTMSATVEITASTGGEHRGEVKELPSFTGYIILRKPADLHILMLVPVIRSRALEMVSDGKTFRLLIPSKNKAVEGQDVSPAPTTPALVQTAGGAAGKGTPAGTPEPRNAGLYELRPYIIRDALLIPAPLPDEFVTLTESSRIMPPAKGRKESTEEPDYDLTVLRQLKGQTLQRERVVHIGRVSLLPYKQEIYDVNGRVVTVVNYDRYAKNGDLDYPMSILISRPQDEYTLRIDFTKLNLNQKVDDEQFVLKIPENIPIQKM